MLRRQGVAQRVACGSDIPNSVCPSFDTDKLPLWSHSPRPFGSAKKEWYGCLCHQGSSCSYHRGFAHREFLYLLMALLLLLRSKLNPLENPPLALIDCQKNASDGTVSLTSHDGVCNIEHGSARPCAGHAWPRRRLASPCSPSSHSAPAPAPASARAWLEASAHRMVREHCRPARCSAELTAAARNNSTLLCLRHKGRHGNKTGKTLHWAHCAKGLSLCRTVNPSRSDCLIVGTSVRTQQTSPKWTNSQLHLKHT
jgi:hypothetical protein